MKQELQKHHEMPIQRQPTVIDMISSMIERGVTSENVAAMAELVKLKGIMDAKDAERDFATAFVALQNDLPVITATSVIPNRGKYERFEDIMKAIKPALVRHGFSVSFEMETVDNRVIATCILMHVGGYSRKNSFRVRVGGKSDSETQADCKAATTAKRRALCDSLNIVIQQDADFTEDDASHEGRCITAAQAADFQRRVKATNSDERAFLRYGKSTDGTYSTISAIMATELNAMLKSKEQR